MERIKRSERLGVMLSVLSQTPNRIHTLGEFCSMFNAAKSTISEDIDILQDALAKFGMGELTTVAGAAGGVRYRAIMDPEASRGALEALAARLREPGRLLPGGFLYTSDVIADPETAGTLGKLLARLYYDARPDFVLTMETKGIPIAFMTAYMLGVPLVIARRDSHTYEGPAVKINYIAGVAGDRIETMALARRSVSPGQRALIIDDFMKGGGTIQGMVDMMREFQAEVVGVGVMIATAKPVEKRVKGVKSLFTLAEADARTGTVDISVSPQFR